MTEELKVNYNVTGADGSESVVLSDWNQFVAMSEEDMDKAINSVLK